MRRKYPMRSSLEQGVDPYVLLASILPSTSRVGIHGRRSHERCRRLGSVGAQTDLVLEAIGGSTISVLEVEKHCSHSLLMGPVWYALRKD